MTEPRSYSVIRFPLMILGILSLAAGLWTGLSRLGWGLPEIRDGVLALHGPIMICGFLGTVIGVERAVALDRPWAYLAPVLSAVGSVIIILTPYEAVGRIMMTSASLMFVIVFIEILRRQFAPFTVTMGLGAVLWLVGNILWTAGYPVYQIVFWWAGFLVLTIAGERLDLSRLLAPSGASYRIFYAAVTVFVAGVAASTFVPSHGVKLLGIGTLALTAWLARNDIATQTIKMAGLTRFVAVCLLSGYFWLGVSGLLAVVSADMVPGTLSYDATLHSMFVGFVIVMIFGHAPIIFPAVLKVPIIYTHAFYLHVVLLEMSLLIRIAGDVAGSHDAFMWGGLINVASIMVFLLNTVIGGIRGVRSMQA